MLTSPAHLVLDPVPGLATLYAGALAINLCSHSCLSPVRFSAGTAGDFLGLLSSISSSDLLWWSCAYIANDAVPLEGTSRPLSSVLRTSIRLPSLIFTWLAKAVILVLRYANVHL